MGVISQLDIINEMLASLGESPLNTLDEAHPLVAAGLRMLRVANTREQAKSWWFNKELVTLTPDAASGYIYTPEDALRVDPANGTLNYVQRGRRLYKAFAPASADSFKFDQPVVCWLVRLVPFDDLPASAQLLVSYAAQLDFQKAYDADPNKYQLIFAAYKSALLSINAENTRNVNANMLRRPGVAAMMGELTPQTYAGANRAPYWLG